MNVQLRLQLSIISWAKNWMPRILVNSILALLCCKGVKEWDRRERDTSMEYIERVDMLEWREREMGPAGYWTSHVMYTATRWQTETRKMERTKRQTDDKSSEGGYQLWTGDFGTQNDSLKRERENDLSNVWESAHQMLLVLFDLFSTHQHLHNTHTHTLQSKNVGTAMNAHTLSLSLKRHRDKHYIVEWVCVCVCISLSPAQVWLSLSC